MKPSTEEAALDQVLVRIYADKVRHKALEDAARLVEQHGTLHPAVLAAAIRALFKPS